MEIKDKKLYERALGLTGEIMQIDICIEELAELMQALIKYKRNKGYEKITIRDSIIEELADAIVMIEQMKITFNVEEEVNKMRLHKLDRLTNRLDIMEERK